jgi:hypothetical protein
LAFGAWDLFLLLGLARSTFTKVSVDIFGRLTQRSQTVKEKSVYLKEQLAFGA